MIQRIKNKITRTWRKSLYLSGLEGILYPRKHAGDIIVMYHGVAPDHDVRFHSRCISRANLRRQLLYYKREFRIVSVCEMIETPNPGIRRLAITFDDGLKNNFNHAAVVLRRLNVPATFFVSTPEILGNNFLWPDLFAIFSYYRKENIEFDGHTFSKRADNEFISTDNGVPLQQHLKSFSIDEKTKLINQWIGELKTNPLKQKENLVQWQMMNDDHIRTLAQNDLFTIGSHGISHQNFPTMSAEEQSFELSASKKLLEEFSRQEINLFSFPDGDYNDASKSLAYQAGYKHLLGVNYKVKSDFDDPNIKDRLGLYQDRSWIEQLHQLNTYFYAE